MTEITPDDEPVKAAESSARRRCDHICLLDDGHVDRGEPHFYGYELPSPRAALDGTTEADRPTCSTCNGEKKVRLTPGTGSTIGTCRPGLRQHHRGRPNDGHAVLRLSGCDRRSPVPRRQFRRPERFDGWERFVCERCGVWEVRPSLDGTTKADK